MIVRSEENPEVEQGDESDDSLPLVVGSLLVAGVWMCLIWWLA